MKKLIPFVLVLCLISSCGGRGKKSDNKDSAAKSETVIVEEPIFDIVTDLGTIRVKLYKDTPKHRDNFTKLAQEGFYNGILFHRVIYGFMIQVGDPLTKDILKADEWGTGGPGYTVEAEIRPEHKHIKGALAAARRGDRANPLRESSGSQFYIVHDPQTCAQLDGQYTVFGETLEGFEVIDLIASIQTDYMDRPVTPVSIKEIKLVGEEKPHVASDTLSVNEDIKSIVIE